MVYQAVEDHGIPGHWRASQRARSRASILECGSPLPPSNRAFTRGFVPNTSGVTPE